MVDLPSYLTVHAPRSFFLHTPTHMHNLLTYDGFLTISDSLDRFLRDVCFGTGRDDHPGFFYNTPQRADADLAVDWDHVVAGGHLAVAYFGTNWDRRFLDLLRALDRKGILEVYGPQAAWQDEDLVCYRGSVPFDGSAPQRVYAACGMGLALVAEQWMLDDVISNRIFEIASVGAIPVCPDMPWIRKWFGTAVLYVDMSAPTETIADRIATHHAFCRNNPVAVRELSARVRAIFEARFSADILLDQLIRFHNARIQAVAASRAALPVAPEVSVVVRCGGRDLSFVRRAVDSIRRQTHGRFHVVLMKYRDIDLSPILAEPPGAVASWREVLIPAGGRAEMLFTGVRLVETEYFAVLDDDDFWLSHHVEDLFRAGQAADPKFDIAFSGSIAFDYPIYYRADQYCDRNILHFGFTTEKIDMLDIQRAIGINCFVARRDLLPDALLAVPPMQTAEDSLLVALVTRRSRPVFSYRATSFYRRGAPDGSNWANHPTRHDDEVSLAMRAGLAWAPRWLSRASWPAEEAKSLAAPPVPVSPDEATEPLRVELAAIECSTSWRLTAPLRLAGHLVRLRLPTPNRVPSDATPAQLRSLLAGYYASTSWRVSAPLRRLATLLRGG
ncbi:MAG: glycosyltransferase family 2 protein [Hyphomicrobiales bacterium]|nr:glycosyltransferase family 2 protein [Hyphomicrobiales bacterium]